MADTFEVNDQVLNDSYAKAVKNHILGFYWPVYKRYEVQVEDGKEFVVATSSYDDHFEKLAGQQTQYVDESGKVWNWGPYVPRAVPMDEMTYYAPLATPELTLDLAECAEREITADTACDWANVYGVLGFPDEDVVTLDFDFMKYKVSHRGRKGSLDLFAQTASEVRTVLRIYEAVTTNDDVDLHNQFDGLHALPKRAYPEWKFNENHFRAWYFDLISNTIQMRLRAFCTVSVITEKSGYYPTGRFALTWGVKCLVGAVWLQLAWLLESGNQVRRCRLPDCRRVIHFEPGTPPPADNLRRNVRGKYKTRSDRAFCKNRGCKQKYNYRKKAGWPNYQ